MKILATLIAKIGMLSVLSVLSLTAQIANGLSFTTTFPFYAGNTKLPAGEYEIMQSNVDANVLLIQSNDRAYSVFVDFTPTQSEQPHAQTDVTFHKYESTEYLNRVWIEGQQYGMKVDPTKAELKAAASATVSEHSIPASKK